MKSRVYILINIYKSFTIPFKSIHFLNVDKINYHIPVQLKGTISRTVFFLTTKRPLGIRGFRIKKMLLTTFKTILCTIHWWTNPLQIRVQINSRLQQTTEILPISYFFKLLTQRNVLFLNVSFSIKGIDAISLGNFVYQRSIIS